MKHILLWLAVITTSVSFAQERFSISAGATSTKFEPVKYDFGKSVSYYAAGHVEGKISEPIGYEAYVQFSDYRYDELAYKSIDVGFMFKYYPISKLYLAPGFQVGKIVRISYDNDNVNGVDKTAIPCYTLGAGYEFTDHVILTARYNGSLEDTFSYIVNLGVKYRF